MYLQIRSNQFLLGKHFVDDASGTIVQREGSKQENPPCQSSFSRLAFLSDMSDMSDLEVYTQFINCCKYVIILKNYILFLSDLADLSDLLVVKNPNVETNAKQCTHNGIPKTKKKTFCRC